MPVKTKEEIELLKKSWLHDPIWDIETTEGFEEHIEELTKFRIEQEKLWENERYKKEQEAAKAKEEAVKKFCDSLGIDNYKLGAFLYVTREKQAEYEEIIGLLKDCLLELDSSFKDELKRNDAWCGLIEKVMAFD